MLPNNWKKMTPDEKMEARLANFLSIEGKPFATPEVAQAYQTRAQRWIDVLKLKEPDRVPRTLILGDYPAHYAGVTQGDMFYDHEKIVQASLKFLQDFDLDYQSVGSNLPGGLSTAWNTRLIAGREENCRRLSPSSTSKANI